MDAASSSEERTELFQKLKPWCVKISQLAIRDAENPATHRELIDLTGKVLEILNDQTKRNPLVLHDKLAEYVFFPLYNIFGRLDLYPMPLLENCIKCLTVIIVHGWKSKIPPELVKEIFTFLTFIINGLPGSERKKDVSEEATLEAFRAETALLTTVGSSVIAASGLTSPEGVPALGHGITVILDAITDGATPDIQREALRALVAIYSAIREQEALASFLPGTISSLTKLASTPNRYKKMTLAKGLSATQTVLTRVLGDIQTRSILTKAKSQEEKDTPSEERPGEPLSPSWLKATVSQLQMALSMMMKLRIHEAHEVKEALENLCISLLDECHTTLANCGAMLIETAMILDRGEEKSSVTAISLQYLIGIYPELGETAKSIVYNWMSSLPRIIQSGDEDLKANAVLNLSKGLSFLRSIGIESSTLDESLAGTLRDSLLSLTTAAKSYSQNTLTISQLSGMKALPEASSLDSTYQSVLLAEESQKVLRDQVISLLQNVGSMPQHGKIAASMLEHAQATSSDNQIAAFWLCFEIIKASHSASASADALFNLSSLDIGGSEDIEAVFNEFYSFSIQLIDSHTEADPKDWRLEALSLEVAAYAAQRLGEAFRPELIDVLFPVATFLGSDDRRLQQHAIITLNSIAASCGYGAVSELIIDNVDYMVSSVALRLNSLDVSPASTQVLLMMVRLAGAQLIPYLDDVIESIFSALENYHGYQSFVESLFSVLKEVVDQAAKSEGRLLTEHERKAMDHRKQRQKFPDLDDLLEFIDNRQARQERDRRENEELENMQGHPTVPWKSEKDEQITEDAGDEGEAAPDKEEEKPQNSPTYKILQRVATLTQHYLTSPTPTLKRSLLELLTTASKVLASDEDSFLPLVNAIWPVVITRLHDPEAFVVIETCNALSGLCEAAGDFLYTRFKTEWSDGMKGWCRKTKQQASSGGQTKYKAPVSSLEENDIVIPIRTKSGLEAKATVPKSREGQRLQSSLSSGGGLGQHASPVKIWEACVKLLTSMIMYVTVDELMFDEILELLGEAMEQDPEIREALEVINEDAVWFFRYEKGLVEWMPAPEMEGIEFPPMMRFGYGRW